MLFPLPKTINLTKDKLYFNGIKNSNLLNEFLNETMRVYNIMSDINNGININISLDNCLIKNDEYIIEINNNILIKGANENAVKKGLFTLFDLIKVEDGRYTLSKGTIHDYAFKQMRGIHIYLPPADSIDECKRFLFACASLKYNTVFLEIGGGMQYDKHPEINVAWTKFCREVERYPEGPWGLQGSEAYWKDSTHIELAGGSFLTKEQVKNLCNYIEMLGMEVIPEIQALSHAYYLTLADNSIAERPYEQYPDTYCPSNDKSYALYEDCATEIIELLHPKKVSIGHDEIRVIGECPLCKDKSGAELLAMDINRLHNFYNKHSIKVFMWGEKLQKFTDYRGNETGGTAESEIIDDYGRKYSLKETYGAIDMIPKDITMLDWYYSQGFATEKQFNDKGFNEIFGNFAGSKIQKWQERASSQNVLGAEVSTWCIPNEYELGFNGWLYEIVFSSAVLWQDNYDDNMRDSFARSTETLLPRVRNIINCGIHLFDGTLNSLNNVYKGNGENLDAMPTNEQPSVDLKLAKALSNGGLTATNGVKIAEKAKNVVLFHAVENAPTNRIQTWAFKDKLTEFPASYAVDYEDGLTIRIPIEFPVMVGKFDSLPTFSPVEDGALINADVDDNRKATNFTECPLVQADDVYRDASSYFCRIARFNTKNGEKSVFAYEWVNPRPNVKITTIRKVNETRSPIELLFFGAGIIK
ncbi:MAG: family 20 glycosylhydrolase [Clostridia bacterium]|nr:family 20 glycosylhydrolase [Clostridia bacterium]